MARQLRLRGRADPAPHVGQPRARPQQPGGLVRDHGARRHAARERDRTRPGLPDVRPMAREFGLRASADDRADDGIAGGCGKGAAVEHPTPASRPKPPLGSPTPPPDQAGGHAQAGRGQLGTARPDEACAPRRHCPQRRAYEWRRHAAQLCPGSRAHRCRRGRRRRRDFQDERRRSLATQPAAGDHRRRRHRDRLRERAGRTTSTRRRLGDAQQLRSEADGAAHDLDLDGRGGGPLRR